MTPKQKQWVDNSPFSELMKKWREEWEDDDPLLQDDEFLKYYSRVYINQFQSLSQVEYDKISNNKQPEKQENSLQKFFW